MSDSAATATVRPCSRSSSSASACTAGDDGGPSDERAGVSASSADPDPPSASVPPPSASPGDDGTAATDASGGHEGSIVPDLDLVDGAGAPALAADLLDALARVVPLVPHAVARVHVRLVRDDEMATLHERHLGVPGTTDVITFPASAGADAVDVDLALCVDEAERQAARRGHGVLAELLLYAVHGILHEAGHDDHDPAAARRMHAEEDRLLVAAGFGAVYGPADRPKSCGEADRC